ncbi:MAG: TrmB family transcriptional regulator [Halobacteriaceae archaeon]
MTGDEERAVEALSRFGLSKYEARVFVALQKLGQGTASEIAEVSDVPRSQVYGAAESLAEDGLIDVQQASPIRYRPVDPAEAEARLSAKLDRERQHAFEYLDEVAGSLRDDGARRAEIWTVDGRDNVDDRVAALLANASERILFGTPDTDRFEGSLKAELTEQAAEGTRVVVGSANEEVLAAVPEGVHGVSLPGTLDPAERSTRVLVVDTNTVLIGVRAADGGETAVWSEQSAFATVLARLLEGLFDDVDAGLQ